VSNKLILVKVTFCVKTTNNKKMITLIVDKIKNSFLSFDKKLENQLAFFFQNWGKSKFMISMSKRAQVLGLEKLFLKGPKAFVYFFLFYLVRDSILYIIIPIFLADYFQS
jgi:hypothetical protein